VSADRSGVDELSGFGVISDGLEAMSPFGKRTKGEVEEGRQVEVALISPCRVKASRRDDYMNMTFFSTQVIYGSQESDP
jgi:hypothetical protein